MLSHNTITPYFLTNIVIIIFELWYLLLYLRRLNATPYIMATDISAIQALLTSVENVNRRYKAVSKVQEEGGTTYNVFDVLGVTTYEVRLHSSIIASLLQPHGHGAGAEDIRGDRKVPS